MSKILYGTLKVTKKNNHIGVNEMQVEFINHSPLGDKKNLYYSGVESDEEINKILANLGSAGWEFVYKQDHKTLFKKVID